MSPFAGDNDIETLKNVKACDWDFDEEAFRYVSEEGRDFIKRLLIKNKEYVDVILLRTAKKSCNHNKFQIVTLTLQKTHDCTRVSCTSMAEG